MESVSVVPPLTDLVAALEHATLMAKQLPTTIDPSQVLHVRSSLQNAHHQLGSFLAWFHSSQPHVSENSVSSTVGEDEPMQVGDDDEVEEENSRVLMDMVEERMRDCVLQNKRRKRPLSPSSAAVEQRPSYEYGAVVHGFPSFDPQGTRLRSLDLVFQFHS